MSILISLISVCTSVYAVSNGNKELAFAAIIMSFIGLAVSFSD